MRRRWQRRSGQVNYQPILFKLIFGFQSTINYFKFTCSSEIQHFPVLLRKLMLNTLLIVHVILSQNIWKGILSNVPAIEDTTDFFKSGAASMDVVR